MWKKKRGSTLVLVLLLFAFVLIIGVGTVMIASVSQNQTTKALGGKQADFTAQSVMDSVIAKIESTDIDPSTIATSGTISGSGSDAKLGSYTFTINTYTSGTTPNLYKISVDALYQGSESKMNSVIQYNQNAGFNAVTQSTAKTQTMIGDTLAVGTITGDLVLNENGGDVSLGTSATTCTGDVYVNGDLFVTGSYIVRGDIFSSGDVTVNGSARVIGNVYAKGNIYVTGGGSVTGSRFSHYSGTTFTATPTNDWTVSPALLQSMAQNIQNITIAQSNITINQNCTLSLSYSSNDYGRKLTFDATNQDIYVMLATSVGQTVNIQDGLDILSKGSHNVYLFLDNGTKYVRNLNVTANCFLGYYNYGNGVPTPNPVANLYIISNKQSIISFTSNSTLNGFIYAPKGSVSMQDDGVTGNGYKLYGAVIASNFNFGSSTNYYYVNASGQAGGSGSGSDLNILGTYIGN